MIGYDNTMTSLEIGNLKCFIAVAEEASFTKAANKVNITQSALSQQISRLEKNLKVQLLDRNKNNSLTDAGENLLRYAKQIVALEQEALDYFLEPELEGEFSFGLPEDFATLYLQDILSNFTFNHPRISVNVECDLTLNLLASFKKNKFDLVLVKLDDLNDFPNGVEIWSEKLVWVAAKSFQRKEGALPLVLSPKPCVYRARALKALNAHNIKSKIVYSSPSYIGSTAAVKAGLGITVLPKNMIPNGLELCNLSELPKLEDTHIALLMKQTKSKVIKSFADYVLAKLHNNVNT